VLLRLRSRALVGIDIHASEIRLLQLRRRHCGFSVERSGSTPLPAGAVLDGKIKQLDCVQAVLKNLVLTTRTQGASAVMALPVSAVISKRVVVPAAALQARSREQFQAYFTGVQDALSFDYAIAGKVENNTADIFLIAAKLESLNDYLLLAEYAGLKLKIIDVDSYALTRAEHFQNTKADIFKVLQDTLKLDTPRFMMCLGLALREMPQW
jgi:type IV pilus assembly protein PilM